MNMSEFSPLEKIEIKTNFFALAAAYWDGNDEDLRKGWMAAAGQPDTAVSELRFRQLKPWRQYALTKVLLLGPPEEFGGVD